MAYRIISPQNSFIQFDNGSDEATSCNFRTIPFCIPFYAEDDVKFQFVVEADTEEEADLLCDRTNDSAIVGIIRECEDILSLVDGFVHSFDDRPERFRLSPLQVLYNWSHSFDGIFDEIEVGECFYIGAVIGGTTGFCSNCLQRISSDCHTSVVEYGNDEDAFGFKYCSSGQIESDTDTGACEPMFVTFVNQSTLVIPYTTSMQDKYGDVPTLKVWIYDTTGELVNMNVRQAFDTYPPTELRFDFGGSASGVIKIS